MEDLENRVGVSHSPLIGEHRRGGGEGGRSVHHIFSLKAFTRMESSFIPFETLRNFLLETFSAFDSLPFFPSSKDSFDVNSLSFLFLELATNRSVSRLVVLQMATKIYRVKSRGGGGSR